MNKKEEKKEEIDPDLKEFLHAPLSLEEMEKKTKGRRVYEESKS